MAETGTCLAAVQAAAPAGTRPGFNGNQCHCPGPQCQRPNAAAVPGPPADRQQPAAAAQSHVQVAQAGPAHRAAALGCGPGGPGGHVTLPGGLPSQTQPVSDSASVRLRVGPSQRCHSAADRVGSRTSGDTESLGVRLQTHGPAHGHGARAPGLPVAGPVTVHNLNQPGLPVRSGPGPAAATAAGGPLPASPRRASPGLGRLADPARARRPQAV